MMNKTEALAAARAALVYYQQQWDTKPNWHTEARLQQAELTLKIMEAA